MFYLVEWKVCQEKLSHNEITIHEFSSIEEAEEHFENKWLEVSGDEDWQYSFDDVPHVHSEDISGLMRHMDMTRSLEFFYESFYGIHYRYKLIEMHTEERNTDSVKEERDDGSAEK